MNVPDRPTSFSGSTSISSSRCPATAAAVLTRSRTRAAAIATARASVCCGVRGGGGRRRRGGCCCWRLEEVAEESLVVVMILLLPGCTISMSERGGSVTEDYVRSPVCHRVRPTDRSALNRLESLLGPLLLALSSLCVLSRRQDRLIKKRELRHACRRLRMMMLVDQAHTDGTPTTPSTAFNTRRPPLCRSSRALMLGNRMRCTPGAARAPIKDAVSS